MDPQLLQSILDEIRITNKLLGISITRGVKSEEQIEMLALAGVKPKDIAEVLGKTSNYVGVALHRIRKAKPEAKESSNAGTKVKSKNLKKA